MVLGHVPEGHSPLSFFSGAMLPVHAVVKALFFLSSSPLDEARGRAQMPAFPVCAVVRALLSAFIFNLDK